ncbi:MAG: hypothetical protein KME49_26665 [Brasilonema octagenarum HA4186-MV1]|nr:hypothetical protein [Brasilonema octagenarum HA4186-MV1]
MKNSLGQFTFGAFIFTVLIAGGGSSLVSMAADTQEPGMVRRVSVSVATGQRGEKLTTIELLPGYGVNLSFIPTGETVQKVWFDNPAIASLDVEGCLEGLGRECEQEGASVLHLRSMKPMNIPGLHKTNSSLLTVITNGSDGRRVYLFRVVVANTASARNHVHTVEVFPDAASSPSIPTPLPSAIGAQGDFHQIRRGLMVALNRRFITENSVLWNRVVSFLVKVRSGEPLSQAAQTSGISMQLVAKLQELGNTSNSNLNSTVNNTSVQRTDILLR